MQFNSKEMAAIFKAAKVMALADGEMTVDEINVIKADLSCFGIKVNTPVCVALEAAANSLEGADMIKTLSNLNIPQKKYVCGYLASVMMADGKKHEAEERCWCLISLLAGFPKMNIVEAVDFWSNN